MTATDGDGDKLTYTISDATPTNTFDHDNDPNTPVIPRFTINPATGQLMVGPDNVKLDYEDHQNTAHSYTVMVTATDSTGDRDRPSLPRWTINVIGVDEKPTFATVATASDTPGVLTAAGVLTAQPEGRTVIDTDDNPADNSARKRTSRHPCGE